MTVPTFCNIEINVPFSINVQPLNVHTYQNCDKLLIELPRENVEIFDIKVRGNNIYITSNSEENVECFMQAPIKASKDLRITLYLLHICTYFQFILDLNIKSLVDVTVGFFNGEHLKLESTEGDITVEKFQGDVLSLLTQTGNIHLKDSIQCTKINATVINRGVKTFLLKNCKTLIMYFISVNFYRKNTGNSNKFKNKYWKYIGRFILFTKFRFSA